MRSQCEECHSAGLNCELDCYPCSNCVERGFADVCPARQARSDLAQPTHSSKEGSQQPAVACRFVHSLRAALSALLVPSVQIYKSAKNVTFLRYLYLPVLLFLPLYYFSQASSVLDSAERCKDEYAEWIGVLETRIVDLDATASSVTLTNPGDIELQPLPRSTTRVEQERPRTAPDSIRVPPPYSSTPAPSSPLVRPPPPASMIKLEEDWCRYLGSRVVEWKIAATTACVFVAASPTIFQIPDASDDPITRSIAFLALCRALSGVIFGPIFPMYFRGTRTRTVHFAMLWSQEAKKSERSVFWGPWIMLSLPAVATCWATIFFLLAIFAYIWRTGSTADPSDWQNASPGRPPMSIDLALALRIVITFITVIDLGCLVWIWRVLRFYSSQVWRDQDGGDGFPASPGLNTRRRSGNLTP
ncbi:hypothetical protein LshimejAT787_1303310 [Lyophyllum shimeji]|uniref:Uncharacterized protein n=1 Tax=Lyophyllum shimeji TaxID=47721 RepID=A0A9P3PWS0_LYOSH|nr:hypothetical protein LshimejAT787_1303310 [Lyophyllum shimeji]